MLAALLLTAAGATSTTAAMRNEVIVIARQSLQGHGHDAAKRARRLRSRHPNPEAVDELWGLASLMGGHRHTAKRRIKHPLWKTIAEAQGRGGWGRARQALARTAESGGPGLKYLAALAFQQAGQDDRAHELLKSALRDAKGALDPRLAPDLGNGIVEAALKAAEGLGDADEVRLKLSEALVASGRRALAIQLLSEVKGRKDEVQLQLAQLWLRIDPRQAERHARRSQRPEARIVEAEAMLAKNAKPAAVRRKLAGLDEVQDEFRGRLAIVIARLLLREDSEDALDAGQQAYRAAPKNPWAVAVYARALHRAGERARALEMAERMMKLAPLEPNPFTLRADLEGRTGQRDPMRLRAQGHEQAVGQLRAERAQKEKVFSAVRDAEASRSAAGLSPLRASAPQAALAVDLALARWGRPGTARAARERILGACAPRLKALLQGKASEQAPVPVTLYGRPTTARVVLSAADPQRCSGGMLRVGQ